MHHCYRTRRLVTLLRLALLFVLLVPLSSWAAPAQSPVDDLAQGLHLLSSTLTGIEFEWLAPAHTLQQHPALGCDLLTIPDMAQHDATGWPALPVSGALFGVPYSATDIRLEILEIEYVDLAGSYSLCPVPRPIWEQTPDELPVPMGYAHEADPAAYALQSHWPADVVALTEEGYLRQQRVAQVALYPFQYVPATGQLRSIQRIRARLSYAAGPIVAQEGADPTPDAYEPLYRDALVNYEQARGWRQPFGVGTESPATLQAPGAQLLKLSVEEQGMIRLTGSDLAASGFPTGEIAPHTIRLFNQGHEIARRIEQAVPGPIQAGDAVYFYGEAIKSPYTATNVYWLTWGSGQGIDMPIAGDGVTAAQVTFRYLVPISTGGSLIPTPAYFTEQLHAKQDVVYLNSNPMPPDQDRWYWGLILASSGPATRVFTSTIAAPSAEVASANLRVYLTGWGTNSSQHSARVEWNGHLIGETTWPIGQNAIFEVSVPQAFLFDGEIAISVTAGVNLFAGQYDLVYLHRFELDYGRRYLAEEDQLAFAIDGPGKWNVRVEGFSGQAVPDLYKITDPLRPVHITNAELEPKGDGYALSFFQSITQTARYEALAPDRYQSPVAMELVTLSNWSDPALGADYLIITHRDFYDAIQPLADYRSAQGMRVMVVDVDDLYDEFNHGIVGVGGIQGFISYAYHNWTPPAPAYVLLVGDGNYDPKNNTGRNEISYLPPYLADVDPWMGETVADNRYVTVHGDDIFPDLFLGRLPVKTAAETTAMVQKILAYEALGREDWQGRITFVADAADAGGDFAVLSDVIVNHFTPATYETERIYYKVTPGHDTVANVRTALFSAFNEGRLLINYKGHASIRTWGADPSQTPPNFLHTNVISDLANGSRQSFIVPMTCLEGYYIVPSALGGIEHSSISEMLVRLEGRGAIASFTPSGLGIATGHEFLNKGLFDALFQDGVTELGPATTLAKLRLYRDTVGYRELIDTYLLMGDPAMTLRVQSPE